jgi:hypothetical protein
MNQANTGLRNASPSTSSSGVSSQGGGGSSASSCSNGGSSNGGGSCNSSTTSTGSSSGLNGNCNNGVGHHGGHSPPETLSKTNLYIRGLHQNTTDKDLVDMCKA